MSFRFTKLFLLTCMWIGLCVFESEAQVVPGEETFGVQYSIVPVLGYNSDYGLFGGGLFQRIDYGLGVRPFKSRSSANFTISTKWNIISKIDHERMESFGREIRSRIRFEGIRLLSNTYFGIGNDTEFTSSAFEDGRYYFEERTLNLRYWGRKNFMVFGQNGKIDGQLLATVSYSDPVSSGNETVFETTRPEGYAGGWVNKAGLGVIVDNRDNEFDPSVGYRFETNASLAGTLTGSSYSFSHLFTELRGYVSPIRNLVIAQKLEFQHSKGDVPFWELPTIGNEFGLRGYALNRFRGDSSLLHIIELRSWLFSILDNQIRFGSQVFMDTGRVFAGDDRLGDLTGNLKQTYGFGGAISILNPDFIFRGDIAFSEDLYRIYLSVGYLF